MTNEMQNKIEELRDILIKEMPDEVVKFTLRITGSDVSYEVETKSAYDLTNNGISMRNLKGNFIK